MEYAKGLIDYLNTQIYESYKNGMSTNEMMEEHDLPYWRVMDGIRKGKAEQIYEDYEKFMSVEEIAKKYGTSEEFVKLLLTNRRNRIYAKAKAWDNYLADVENSIREVTGNEDEIK